MNTLKCVHLRAYRTSYIYKYIYICVCVCVCVCVQPHKHKVNFEVEFNCCEFRVFLLPDWLVY